MEIKIDKLCLACGGKMVLKKREESVIEQSLVKPMVTEGWYCHQCGGWELKKDIDEDSKKADILKDSKK